MARRPPNTRLHSGGTVRSADCDALRDEFGLDSWAHKPAVGSAHRVVETTAAIPNVETGRAEARFPHGPQDACRTRMSSADDRARRPT